MRSRELTDVIEEWRDIAAETRSEVRDLRTRLTDAEKRAREVPEAEEPEDLEPLRLALAAREAELDALRKEIRLREGERDGAYQQVQLLKRTIDASSQRVASLQRDGAQMLGLVSRQLAENRDRERGEALNPWQARPRPRKRFAAISRRRPFVSLLRRVSLGRSILLFLSGLYAGQDGPGGRNLLRLGRNHTAAVGPHPLLDMEHYSVQSQDIGGGPGSKAIHYLLSGEAEGRTPHPLFDPEWYRDVYDEILHDWPLTALEHFIMRGAYDGLDPHPLFDVSHYVTQVPSLARTGQNPLAHYLSEGWREGYDPHPLFNSKWYAKRNPDVIQVDMPPLLHFLRSGAAEFRDPHPLFSVEDYLRDNPDVGAVGLNPLVHYLGTGWREGRAPCRHFDPAWYLEKNPDVAAAGIEPLTHYLTQGAWEGRQATRELDAANFLSIRPEQLLEGMTPLQAWIEAGKPVASAASLTSSASASISSELSTASSAVAPGAGSQKLFKQLYDGSREQDPNSYNWPVYRELSAKLKDQDRKRIESLRPEPPKLVDLKPGEVRNAAEALSLKTSDAPDVSIIIPVYNAVKFTVECLKSLERSRTRKAFEVIVIDDASSDETEAVVSSVKGLRYMRNKENLGFLKTVNRAASEARGERLVILNNDVQVEPGWLDPLINALDDDTIGIAAPMMLFPNGRLQEAGARLDAEGNSRMIGLFDDPTLPRYNYARDVDYVSGACIAVRRKEFEAFGGFDLDYAPAYCEDCDLCFKYTDKGFRIRYEPESKIYHHLSVTSNALPGSYKMRQVRRNQQKLLDRWGEAIDAANDVKVISLYLPQYHTIPENDRWWGAGFTEWTNVTRALPNFAGHYQPHRPAELGSYDLTNPEVMERQAELAKRYGVHGFCYYYYWFSGRRVLEAPLERLLSTGKPDIPFCICWANENWTRTWDGQEKNVLLEQKYRKQDDKAIILDLIRYMRLPNYIRVNGKPLVVVYRPKLLPNPKATAALWREICRKEGIGEIYLSFMEVFEEARSHPDPSAIGFDASIEFPPSNTSFPMAPPGELFNTEFSGTVTDYRRMVESYTGEKLPAHTRFRGVMPSWDNTARRQDGPYVFHNANPGAFQAWLERIIEQTKDQNSASERLVFVNAWNEWAEGAHLEPDEKFGRGWLEAVRNALDSQYLLKG